MSAGPPVNEYSLEFQARAAEELALLPEGSAIAKMLADYAVMREQARTHQTRLPLPADVALIPQNFSWQCHVKTLRATASADWREIVAA